jgi:hypothetical protein
MNNSVSVDSSSNVVSSQQISVVLTLSELLLAKVNSPTYQLTETQIQWIQQFIKASPDSFQRIASDVQSIVSDGKIDLHDIPALVKLLADIYNTDAIPWGLSHPANIIVFVKFTVDVIFSSQYLMLPDAEKKAIQLLIDTSLDLLSMKLHSIENLVEEVKMSKCIGSIFSCSV